MDHSTRTDTVMFIRPSERPLPPKLSPRQAPRAQRAVVTLLLCSAAAVVAVLALPLIAVAAYVIPQPVFVALLVVAAGVEIVRRATIATAGVR